jgi:hypothetical protein
MQKRIARPLCQREEKDFGKLLSDRYNYVDLGGILRISE